MKLFGIDAFMCQGGQGYMTLHKPAMWQRAGDHYDMSHSFQKDVFTYWEPTDWVPAFDWDNWKDATHKRVERPSSNGEGGGKLTMILHGERVTSMKIAGRFDGVRSFFDRITERWRSIPDPDSLNSIIENLTKVYLALGGVDHAPPGSSAYLDIPVATPPDVNIISYIGVMKDSAGCLRGRVAVSYRALFIDQVGFRVGNICNVALELLTCVVAQKLLWEGARKDVLGIFAGATTMFDNMAKGKSGSWRQVLMIASQIAHVAKVVPTDAASKAAATAIDIGLEAAYNSTEDTVEYPGIGYFSDATAALENTLRHLNGTIGTQEDAIRKAVVARLSDIWTHRGGYRLRGDGRVRDAEADPNNSRAAATLHFDEVDTTAEFSFQKEDVVGGGTIAWTSRAIECVGAMRKISELLMDQVRDNLTQADEVRTRVTRDTRVGVGGGYGPSAAVKELYEELISLLTNAAGELDQGADNLEAAYNYWKAVEEGHTAALPALAQMVDSTAADMVDGTGTPVNSYRTRSWYKKMGGA